MRIVFEGSVIPDFDIAGRVPAHPRVLEFEGTVLDHLGIEATIGSEVDVLEEDAVHRWLDYGTRSGGLDVGCMGDLCRRRAAENGCEECQ